MKRKLGPLLALLAAAAIVVCAWSRSFWVGRLGEVAELHLGLRSARTCVMGVCERASLAELVQLDRRLRPWAILAFISFYAGLLVAALLAGAAALMLTQGEGRVNRAATMTSALLVLLAGALFAAFPGRGETAVGWALPALAAASLLGVFAGIAMSSAVADAALGGREARLLEGSARAAGQRAPRSTRASAPDYQQAIKAASGITFAKAASADIKKPPQGASQVRDAAADATARLLRFVVHKLEIDDAGLRASVDGAARTLAWSDLASAHAGQLPPDPPFEKLTFLDLVPHSGAPLRLLPSTRANYAALPGGAAPTSVDNFRRLLVHAADQQPALALDAETAAFAREQRPAHRYAGVEQFAAYDARFP